MIARGTLDEVLWILLKRKFRALGEFVEGKEMMDYVVHNSYNNEFDAVDRKCETKSTGDTTEIDKQGDANALADEGSIQHDLEELATEEQNFARGSDDDIGDEEMNSSSPVEHVSSSNSSQNDIICLSDDDEEDRSPAAAAASKKTAAGGTSPEHYPENEPVGEVLKYFNEHKQTDLEIRFTMKLPDLKFYYMYWTGDRYGVTFFPFFGRLVVGQQKRKAMITTPSLGHIVVAINSWPVPYGAQFNDLITVLKQSLATPPVRIVFAHDNNFTVLVKEYFTRKAQHNSRRGKYSAGNEARVNGQTSATTPGVSTQVNGQTSAPTAESQAQEPHNPLETHEEEDGVIEILDD